MANHLISLAELHAAAPGVLDVIFGPDGDFEGAPCWDGPVMAAGCWANIVGYDTNDSFAQLRYPHGVMTRAEFEPFSSCALDIRVPSVAARLAGLCARAMGFDLFSGAVCSAYQHGEYFTLAGPHGMQDITWGSAGWPTSRWRAPPDLPRALMVSPSSFLAALTLALAPRIAALGVSR